MAMYYVPVQRVNYRRLSIESRDKRAREVYGDFPNLSTDSPVKPISPAQDRLASWLCARIPSLPKKEVTHAIQHHFPIVQVWKRNAANGSKPTPPKSAPVRQNSPVVDAPASHREQSLYRH